MLQNFTFCYWVFYFSDEFGPLFLPNPTTEIKNNMMSYIEQDNKAIKYQTLADTSKETQRA